MANVMTFYETVHSTITEESDKELQRRNPEILGKKLHKLFEGFVASGEILTIETIDGLRGHTIGVTDDGHLIDLCLSAPVEIQKVHDGKTVCLWHFAEKRYNSLVGIFNEHKSITLKDNTMEHEMIQGKYPNLTVLGKRLYRILDGHIADGEEVDYYTLTKISVGVVGVTANGILCHDYYNRDHIKTQELIVCIDSHYTELASLFRDVDSIKVINDHDNYGSQTFPMDDMDTKRPELTTGNRGIQSKISKAKPDSTVQSFEKIIMECQDMLSIDEKVESMYAEWLKKGKRTGKKKSKLGFYAFRCISILIGGFGIGYNIMMAMDTKGNAAWIYMGIALGLLVLQAMLIHKIDFKEAINTFTNFLNCIFFNLVKPEEKPSPHSKFQFLKETYQKTIDDLDSRLTIVLGRINEQINCRKADITEIESNKDIFGNSSEVIHEIARDIVHLETRRAKVKQKQESIKQTMEEYLGKQGYIAQKEQEIERLKKAQELTDRIKENHKVTLEITKQVDVLTDVIIPGIKRLMEFRIPELINEVEYEHDRETALLEIKG